MQNKNLVTAILLIVGMFLSIIVNAQTLTMAGKVVDEKGRPLSGVNIKFGKSNKEVSSSNAAGTFRITPATGANVIFSLVGYDTQTISAQNNTNITIRLLESNHDVGEVVVRGYQNRSREESTGSSVKIASPQDRPAANLESLLQGRVPGLNIQVNTGAPGFRGSTQIRGLSTLTVTGSGDQSFLTPTSPLYVIDGVPMDADRASEMGLTQQGPGISPLSLIPPEDVESIEVLKDAQATSMYGSLAAYGVIIITTKRGNSEVPRVRYTSNFFMRSIPKLRETLGGNLERRLKLEQIFGNARSQADIDRILDSPWLLDSLNAFYNNSTDWQSLYFRNTYNQTHNLAIDGGNPQLNYKANINYYNESGIVRNTGFDRVVTNLRMEYSPNNKFKFIAQVQGSLGKKSKGDGIGILQNGVATGGESSTLLPGPSFFLASSGYSSAMKTKNDNSSKSIKPYLEVSYAFLDGFRWISSLNYELTSDTEDTFTPAIANNQFSKTFSYYSRYNTLYNRNVLTYSKSIKDKHNFFINVFNEIRTLDKQAGAILQQRTPNDQFQGPFGFDGFYSRGGGILSDGLGEERAVSFAASASYNYKKRYVMDLAYRMDGSSRNGFGDLYTRNPSIGLRWNGHQEEFLKDVNWIDMLSVRGSWGMNVMPNSTLERVYGKYDITGRYNNKTGIGINYSQIPNPNLKPTTTTQYNVGVDLTLFKNKFQFTYDTYYKKVDNILFAERLSSSLGFEQINSNSSAIGNYGHELMLSYRPFVNNKWNFNIGANGAYNRDVLLKLPAHYRGQYVRWEDGGQNTVFRVGTSTMSNYLLLYQGVYATDNDVPINPATGKRYSMADGTPFKGGDPIFADLNGDFILDGNDFARTGNSQPLFTGGIQLNLDYSSETWGTIQFNMGASYTAKRTVLNNALAQRLGLMSDPFGQKVVVPLDDIDMWRNPGDQARYPYAFDYTRYNNIKPFRMDQTLWAEDGSYLKINNIVLAYMFTKDFARRLGLQRFRVYVSADNVYTFSKYSGPNPENVTTMGRDVSTGYPVPRQYNLGLNIDF
ncbi:SusC/RagA family TonB-linked outer membrane protein [Sphingobacterium sp. Mn56C]|uniref:SusC/RagA family TonB-linked outer membrane protein n=1 Tax=Sphingobacterium sp. Mn56C TaxID=3395261 RepID=UPI003BDCAD19